MMVLVDTPVWSLALRRRPEHITGRQQSLANILAELIREGRAQLVGPIRQELLSGIREEAQFKKRRSWAILTTDRDFQNYASVLPVRLHLT
jgi:predicted nucleic acid-binding protein